MAAENVRQEASESVTIRVVRAIESLDLSEWEQQAFWRLVPLSVVHPMHVQLGEERLREIHLAIKSACESS